MPTVIDSLVVKLGLDSKDFDKGKSSVTSGLKDIASLLGIIGGTAAIKHFIMDMIESNAALERFSRNLGLSTQAVSAWGQAAEQAGGTAQGLQGTLDMLSKQQTQMQLTGESSLIPYFSALGVAMADASGKARPATEILVDLSDRFSKMDRTTAYNMGRSMGIDEGTMNLLLRGRQEVERMVGKQKDATAVSKAQAEQSEKLRQQTVAMKQEFSALGRDLLTALLPILQKVFDMIRSGIGWMRENKEFVGAFLTIIAVGLSAIAIAALPLSGTAVLIIALGAAIAALWQDYQVWKRGGKSLINWEWWEYGINRAIRAIGYMRNAITDLWYRIKSLGSAFVAIWNHDWAGFKQAIGEVWSGNGKPYAPQTPPPAAPSGGLFNTATASAREGQAMRYFQSQGWTQAQAAGLVANLKRESRFNSSAVGDSGRAYGIGQWHPDRQAAFRKAFGKDIRNSSFEEQLAFVQFELTQGAERGAGQKLRQATTAQAAGATVSQSYLRPADRAGEAAVRGQMAAGIGGGAQGATQMAQRASAGATATMSTAQFGARGTMVSSGTKVTNTIGAVNVYTQATDADGIARDMSRGLNAQLTAQADSGMY